MATPEDMQTTFKQLTKVVKSLEESFGERMTAVERTLDNVSQLQSTQGQRLAETNDRLKKLVLGANEHANNARLEFEGQDEQFKQIEEALGDRKSVV